jgi:Zinc dependent phospholipase C
MPGPYAHITLLHELIKQDKLEYMFSPSSEFSDIIKKYFPYCALGAVSPDYPNLARKDNNAYRWADAMHYTRACEMITSGIKLLRYSEGAVRDKQLAWLLGYCAHVATDVTIHPIVQAKVGVYSENQRQHRVCEMNQDSYIYSRMNLGEIGQSDLFARTITKCSDSACGTLLDRDIVNLWSAMLEEVHPDLFIAHPPVIELWHSEFVTMVEDYRDENIRLFPLAAIIADRMDLAYPKYIEIDQQFLRKQLIPTPTAQNMHYNDIFDHAVDNVADLWNQVELAVYDDNNFSEFILGDWNLDNGLDENDKLVFW